ncbi:MAG: alpha/beta fold hydrolase [Acidimicrobiales bacterium]
MPYATNGSVRLYHETFGEGSDPTLLLVNGLGSQCIRYSEEWCARFVDAGFHVIRFDNRDVGLSTSLDDAPDGEAPYLLRDMAADAVAVLDAVGVERAHVMGLSMGGMIAQTMAIEHPHRMLTMTSVMSSTGDSDVGRSSPEAYRLLVTPARPDLEGVVERAIEAAGVYGSPDHIDPERLRALAAADFERAFNPAGVGRQLRAVNASGSRSDALRSIGVPTLVIHGDQDRLIDVSGGVRTAEVIPGARLEIIEGMGHDYPPAFWDRLVSLVASHAGVVS